MNKEINSFMDFEAPLDVVSIALNGLLKLDGPVTKVRNNYSIDVKNEVAKKQDSEVKLLYAYFFKYILKMDITLSEISESRTRMNFTIIKGSYKASMIMMVVFQILFALLVGAGFAAGMNSAAPLVVFLIAFAITALIFSFMPYSIYKTYVDKSYQARFTKQFLPRIISYIEIVKRNKKI